MILQAGGQMLDASETAAGFGGEIGLKALRYCRQFVTDGSMPLIDWDQSRQQFIAGKIGIFVDTPARLRQVTDLIGDKFTLGTCTFPIDDKAEGRAADRRQRGDHHGEGSGEAEGRVGVPQIRDRPGGAEDRGRDDRLHADQPARAGAGIPRRRSTTRTRTSAPCRSRSSARKPWQGYPGGNSVRIWRTQREIINAVMRGETTAEAGLERIVKESNALMKSS